uniref:zonadhesin-like isoform X2 n=1 Tax=Solea senegalensis TaxID=28829 RepID=UPI001CD91294|nr:zonadhesin-like isoform X2 [Solea senegalensis]
MLGGFHTDLLLIVTLLFLSHTGIQCRAEHHFSLVPLPEWRPNSEYVTQCFYSRQNNLICDWTRSQQRRGDVAVTVLESGTLGLEEEACLEFWYQVPFAASGSELRVLLKSSAGLVEIWTSPALITNSWTQVFVPLKVTKPETQVVLEAKFTGEQITFNQMGVRRGLCGPQCESNTELWTDESTLCICSEGQHSCFPSQCPEGQICGPQRRGSTGMSTTGMCTIHSHTDCSTFDGMLFRFMAPCTYTLAKTCSSTKALPMFSVEVVNEQDGNSSLPAIQQVNVNTENFRVSFLKRQTQRVVVNGLSRKLPLSLSNGSVNIQSNPAAVVLVTSFGLSVSYDNAGALHVILPSSYSGEVCGLCGNFNHFKEDDLRKPDGTTAQNATVLAKSWQTGQITSSCETILVPHECDPLEKAVYASEFYCGGLISNTGPFADCQSVLGAESYFRGCVVSMCSTHGDPAVLCETLQVYSNICKEAGVAVPIWRNSTFCSLQCAENSHYNVCADGCPEVCSSLDLTSSCGNCEERCECDNGFKLSGGKCVPAKDCGCWYNGKHYEKGSTFVEGQCEQQCHCVGNNDLTCTSMRCANNEVCKVRDGVKDCFPFMPTTCSVYGDPHYITFDKTAYDFQGGCSYTLTTTCGVESPVQFSVIGHNMHPPLQNFTLSKLEAATLHMEDFDFTLNQNGEVYVNDHPVKLPYSTSETYGSVWVYMHHSYIILETSFGVRMMVDGQKRLFLQVDESYKYELCGLCGTFSGYQDDDFVTPEGQHVTEPFDFGDSWRVQNNYECTAYPNVPRHCDYDEENKAYNDCSPLLGEAFQLCHETIHPNIYLSSCVYDYCATNGDQQTLCESLKSYAAACQVAGVELPPWQADTACDLTKPTTPAPANNSTTTAKPQPPTTTARPKPTTSTQPQPPTTTAKPQPPTTTTTPQPPIVCNFSCSFDNDLCSWNQMITDAFDWTWHSGSTPTPMTGPSADHTGGGHYLYIEASSVTHGDTARLISSECLNTGPQCLQFWYHMYGSADTMGLHVYQVQNRISSSIWRKRNDQGNAWHLAQVDLTPSGAFQIFFEGRRGSNDQSDVAIDDISLHHGHCGDLTKPTTPAPEFPPANSSTTTARPQPPTTTTKPQPPTTTARPQPPTHTTRPQQPIVCNFSCSFDNDLCSWNQMITDAFDWTWHSGSTPTPMTGPSADHTGGGHYLYIEASSVTHGDTARLISSECLNTGPQCLQFWYHMYGSADTMGLHVYQVQNRISSSIWRKRNDQGNAWHLAQVDLTPSGAFQIFFEGRRGSNDQSDVAIDDISLHHGHCGDLTKPTTPAPEFPPANSSTTTARPQPPTTTARPKPPTTDRPQPPTTTTKPQPPTTTARPQPPTHTTRPQQPIVCNFGCSFDNDLCSWNQMITDAFDWTRHSGSTPTPMTGPSADHTGGGHYLYIEASSVTHGDTARLISSECLNIGPQCLQFWYHMYGSADTMGLHVYQVQNSISNSIWWKRNDQGNSWHLAQVDLTSSGAFQIFFEGRRGSNDQSDVAIDDISLYHGHCEDLTRPTTPAPANSSTTTVRPQPPTTTARSKPPTSTQPQTPSMAPTESQSTSLTQSSTTTTEPQPPTSTARPQPSTTTARPPTTTTRPNPPTTTLPQTSTTIHSESQTSTQQPSTTSSRPQPPTTDRPQPSTTSARPLPVTTTARPQPTITTVRPNPATSTQPQTPSIAPSESQATSITQSPTTTAGPQPPTTTFRPRPTTTTARPYPTTPTLPPISTTVPSESQKTSILQSSTPTSRPQPPTTDRPQPPTSTGRPQPSTTTARPQPPTTTLPQTSTIIPSESQTTIIPEPSTTSSRPQPQTTDITQTSTTSGRPLPVTTTARPQPPITTVRPNPATSTQPQTPSIAPSESQATSITQSPTTTAGPQPPTTTFRPRPTTTTARPYPTTPTLPPISTTVPSESQKTSILQSSTPTSRPQPPTTDRPQPPTSTGRPQPSTTTARPQPPTTTLPQTSTIIPSESQTTIIPEPSTTSSRPQPQTTDITQTSTTSDRPLPVTTTARPQPPITTVRPNPATSTQPQTPSIAPSESQATSITQSPTTTAGPQPPTTTFRPRPTTTTARPYPTTPTLPQISTVAPSESQTTSILQSSTPTSRPQPPTTDRPQPPTSTGRPQPSTTTARPQPPTTTPPQTSNTIPSESQTTIIPEPSTTSSRPQPQTTDITQTSTTSDRPLPVTTTARPQPPITTVRPNPATSTQPQTPSIAPSESQATSITQSPTTTAAPQPPTTTFRPQPTTTTARPYPTTPTLPQISTVAPSESQTISIPQPATTSSWPQPQTTDITHNSTTSARPLPVTTTARPQPTITTVRPNPATTTARPQPQTTTLPQTSTTAPSESQTTSIPPPSTTSCRPQPPTTDRPQPSTTSVWPLPVTTTARPQPPITTVRPNPATSTQPQTQSIAPSESQATSITQFPTTTVGPQPPTTTFRPRPTITTARPNPPTTTLPPTSTKAPSESQTISIPQPSTTSSWPQPQNTDITHTTVGPNPATTTARPQPPTTTARPQPPTTTARPPPPTTTAKPQPPTTTARPTPFCPENSHYTSCIPACSPTCSNLNGPPHCNNSNSCEPGCVCNDGFVRKLWRCVPIEECGCVDSNGNKHQFNEIWYADHCSQKCECEKDDGLGEIDCDDDEECDKNAVCLQNDKGEYYCKSTDFSGCTIEPDPEYRTFDKIRHDFKGKHSYVLVRTNNLPNNLPDVYIVSINTHREDNDDGDDDDDQHDDDSSSEENHSRRVRDEDEDDDDDDSEESDGRYRLKELKIVVYNHTVELKKNSKLVVDGKRTKMPVSPTAGLNIRQHSSQIYLKTDFGLSVEFDGRNTAEITLPHIYRSKVGGLCGNFDGQKWNEKMKPDGTRAKTVQEFGESWRV